jgi:hypothetical protein
VIVQVEDDALTTWLKRLLQWPVRPLGRSLPDILRGVEPVAALACLCVGVGVGDADVLSGGVLGEAFGSAFTSES